MDLTSFEKPLIMGHRGYQANYPENTMVSFLAAVKAGAQFVELDVSLTRDREVIVMHDDTVDRTTDGTGLVADYTLADLKRLDAGSWFQPKFAGERVPMLAEVLKQVGTQAFINIEVKSYPTAVAGRQGLIEERVVEEVQKAAMAKRVLVSSFDAGVIARVTKIDPAVTVALIAERSDPLESVAQCKGLGVFSFHPDLAFLDHETVKALHNAGVHVFPWNIDAAGDVQKALSLGVDGLIAKDPVLVLQCHKKYVETNFNRHKNML